MSDDAEDDPRDDPDRAAIMARRQRFIALALSSLSAACDRPAPNVCLKVDPSTIDKGEHDKRGAPKPCLDVDRPEPRQAPATEPTPPEAKAEPEKPQPCLDVARPEDPEPQPQPQPQPCLRVAPK